jgi:multidrug efflux pump subunit AcrA (membrane-fusion protein)
MSTETYSPSSLDSESEMLPQDPPPKVIRFIGWWLISLFVIGLLVAIFVHLPETEHAAFILVPRDGADPIQSPRLATVSRVLVTEGQTVAAGAELFVLRSDEIRAFDTQQRTLTEDLHTQELTLAKMDEAYAAEANIKNAQVSQAESELRFREKQTASNRDLLNRLEKLSKSGGFSQIDLIKLQLEAAGSEKDQAVAQRTLEQVRLERQQLENQNSRKRAEQAGEVEKLKMKLGALKGDLENSQQNLLTIRAPYDAVILSLAQRNVGSVVQSGQELCQLGRTEAKPLARLMLNESGLAKLKSDQPVRFFFEAFPYQRYGALSGKLDWVSPSPVTDSTGQHFVALASIDESANRRHLPLRSGMKGEARVRVGSRTLIEFALEPIRQLREGIQN